MNSFEHAVLRLKQATGAKTDKEVGALLGLTPTAFGERKRRDAFPVEKLVALAASRPALNIDVDFVLTGRDSRFEARIAALKDATTQAMSFAIPKTYQVFLRDLLFAIAQNDARMVETLIDELIASDPQAKRKGEGK